MPCSAYRMGLTPCQAVAQMADKTAREEAHDWLAVSLETGGTLLDVATAQAFATLAVADALDALAVRLEALEKP